MSDFDTRAREIVSVHCISVNQDVCGSLCGCLDVCKIAVSAISSALKEAYDQGRKSEAAMWELAKLGQEIDEPDAVRSRKETPDA